jgi:hypothetical protein
LPVTSSFVDFNDYALAHGRMTRAVAAMISCFVRY